MQTSEIARHLAHAAGSFPWLGPVSAEGLLALVRLELGSETALESFRPYGGAMVRAVGPGTILHIVSGNTPHAALQSLIRGLLVGARNRCKLPGTGLPEVEQFRAALPPELAARVETARELPEAWLAEAEVVIVFGGDATIAHFRERVEPWQRFIPHGHRYGFGVVFDDPAFESVAGAARDASLFDQQGCLSPHLFYVRREQAREYARRLALEMEAFAARHPPAPLSVEEAGGIAAVREEFRFRAAIDPQTALWESEGGMRWSVLLDPTPAFTPSCLNRTIYVKPLPDDLPGALRKVRPHLGTIGIHPATPEQAGALAGLGVSRICPIGRMQEPPLTWHHDGQPVLSPLVTWLDFEYFRQPVGPLT